MMRLFAKCVSPPKSSVKKPTGISADTLACKIAAINPFVNLSVFGRYPLAKALSIVTVFVASFVRLDE